MSQDLETPMCWKRKCKHFIGAQDFGAQDEEDQRLVCKAFPQGIPYAIQIGRNLHLIPVKGQKNQIVYEKEEA